ncbi:hypothetical protein ABW21_db0201842 [Orbilia brochopaga]|nr:hypothetical protein ABW21_db0201842 [Drechslerella brochopaga]
MRFSAFLGPSVLFLAASTVGQQTIIDPQDALGGATKVATGIKTFFANQGGLVAAATISRDIIGQLNLLTTYLQNTVLPSVNPDRFQPRGGTVSQRTCDQRRDIFNAYKTFFMEVIAARQAMQTALCSVEVELPLGLLLGKDVALDALSQRAKDMLTQTEQTLAQLWDNVLGNPYNSFDFFIYNCKIRLNEPGCRDPGEGCTEKPSIPCSEVCDCYYGFIDGANPNLDQCFSFEQEITDAEEIARSATYGFDGVKDCRTCYPDKVVSCVALPLIGG